MARWQEIAFAPDGKTAALPNRDVMFVDAGTQEHRFGLRSRARQDESDNDALIRAVAYRDPTTIVGIDDVGRLLRWDLRFEDCRYWTICLAYGASLPSIVATLDAEGFSIARFSPDGSRLALMTGRGLALIDTTNGATLRRYEASAPFDMSARPPLQALAFSPDGRRLAAAAAGVVQTWSIDGRAGARYQGDADVSNLVFAPDGKSLVVGRTDCTLTLHAERSP